MNIRTISLSLLVVAALLLPVGSLSAQDRTAAIDQAKSALQKSATEANRLNLSKLQYEQGLDNLKSGNLSAAIDALQASVWTLEDGKGQVPESHGMFQDARYGLAFALNANNNAYEALLVLDQAVNADPGNAKAQYLLGVTLANVPGEQSVKRSVSVLTELAKSGSEPYRGWAQRAAIRLGYNLSTLAYAQNDAAGALTTLTSVTDPVGIDNGADADENAKLRFAMGVYLRDTGDVVGALENLEALHSMNESFRTSGGVAATGMLANMYYAAGLEQLSLGGDSANQTALANFEDAQRVGDDGLDMHHGKAAAYTRLGQSDKAVAELQIIVKKDASYYGRIKK